MSSIRGTALCLLSSIFLAHTARAALAVSPHSMRMHLEWNRCVKEEDWDDWILAFDRADTDNNGRLGHTADCGLYCAHPAAKRPDEGIAGVLNGFEADAPLWVCTRRAEHRLPIRSLFENVQGVRTPSRRSVRPAAFGGAGWGGARAGLEG